MCQRSSRQVICLDCDRQIQACKNAQFSQGQVEPQIPLYCWGKYDQALRRAIEACKYHKNPQIAYYLGQQMAISAALPVPKSCALVPIPLHRQKQKLRGFNQAEELARGLSDRTGIRCRPELLRRVKNTQPQFQMVNVQARQENLRGAFIANSSGGKGVIIVDDIYTTGTTVRQAIAAFKAVSTPVIAVIALARPLNNFQA
ncbi:MAG: phosphoribosyltransferase family protein [Pseudanabaenaceae cyanobacterium bins.68]|nr:phosphoribosyltransferase family protein [Pseudanabaenaceae cyanobacterium bins.68]